MSDHTQAIEELKSTWEAHFKPLVERLEAEEKARGDASAETQAQIEKVQDALDALERRYQDAIEERFQKLALERRHQEEEPTREHRAFTEFIRKGEHSLGPEERKALTVSDDTQAGFLAPPEFRSEFLKGITEMSPMRGLVRVITTDAPSVTFPKRTQPAAAMWAGELDPFEDTQAPKVGLEEIPTHELRARVDVSNWMLEDGTVDVERWVLDEVTEAYAVKEGAAFISGTGVGQPEGFLTNAEVISGAQTSGADDGIVGDDLIKLYFALKTAYARRATWVMQRSTIRVIRTLKETSTDNYLWQPGLAGTAPATILDRPYVEAPDMPQIADAAYPIALGDFGTGYFAVDRTTMTVQRDPYTRADHGQVRFRFRRRQGGQVVVPEAIKLLKIA